MAPSALGDLCQSFLTPSCCTRWARDHTELLHHGSSIQQHPMVNDFPPCNPICDEDRNIEGFPRRRNAHEWTFMRASCPATYGYQIALRNHLFDIKCVERESCLTH